MGLVTRFVEKLRIHDKGFQVGMRARLYPYSLDLVERFSLADPVSPSWTV